MTDTVSLSFSRYAFNGFLVCLHSLQYLKTKLLPIEHFPDSIASESKFHGTLLHNFISFAIMWHQIMMEPPPAFTHCCFLYNKKCPKTCAQYFRPGKGQKLHEIALHKKKKNNPTNFYQM